MKSNTQKSAIECAPTGRPSGATCAQRQPELVDPEVLMYATRIASKVMKLSPVACEAMEMLVDRYVLGQERYGEPDLDGRDWILELEQEECDRIAYRPLIALANRRRRLRGLAVAHVEPPTVAITFDCSDVELVHPFDDEPTIERSVVAYTEGRP
jgi:hypothetical protein